MLYKGVLMLTVLPQKMNIDHNFVAIVYCRTNRAGESKASTG